MKATLLKSVVCFTLVLAGALNSNVMAADQFVTNDVMSGQQVASRVIYRHDGMLYRHMKNDFKYDAQGRVVEKETLKWNSTKEAWMPYTKISLTYTSDRVVMNYARWNAKDQTYTDRQEKNVYEVDAANVPVAYQNYKWNDLAGEWKIAEDYRFGTTTSLYAIHD